MTIPNPLGTVLHKLPVDNAGEATDMIALAHGACLRASYHPNGGHAPKRVLPITHTIHLEGTPDQIQSFLHQIGDRSDNEIGETDHEEPNPD